MSGSQLAVAFTTRLGWPGAGTTRMICVAGSAGPRTPSIASSSWNESVSQEQSEGMNKGTREIGKRMQRRYGAMGMLIIAPLILLMAAVKFFEQHDYPAGDLRNEPAFWAALGVAALIFVGVAMVGSIREIPRSSSDGPPST